LIVRDSLRHDSEIKVDVAVVAVMLSHDPGRALDRMNDGLGIHGHERKEASSKLRIRTGGVLPTTREVKREIKGAVSGSSRASDLILRDTAKTDTLLRRHAYKHT